MLLSNVYTVVRIQHGDGDTTWLKSIMMVFQTREEAREDEFLSGAFLLCSIYREGALTESS